jgi:hypothetical protein
VIGIIGYLQILITNNYNIIADLHNLQSLRTNLMILSALVLTYLTLKTFIYGGTNEMKA